MAALSPGTRLGPYEVVEAIGAGGMGEVYRARDTTLGRDVAIKVLPEDFAADKERLARFRREAQVLASLNHPNIAAIYGTEENALILELVEGPTLAERLSEGRIPVDEAIAIARQIAEALEAAHEAGIIHRDLKPPNVKVQEDGTVKVLDFGLAKAIEGEAEGNASESPTMSAAATRAGVIMGTAAYMSPEQARGKQVDRRADIWAFGVVVYEMLTGRRAFEAEDISLTLAEVMKSEPDWEALPGDLSPTLRTYLTLCLEKDPKRRVRDIGDVRLAMDGVFETGATSPSEAPAERRVGWPAIAMALVLSVVTGIVGWSLKPEAPRPLVRFVANAPSEAPNFGPPDVDVAITPDGTRIVYPATIDGRQVVVRALDELEATPLEGLGNNPRGLFLSPDGNWVGVFTGSALQKVSILGGPPVTICEPPGGAPRGGSWGDDGTIVFATSGPGGLWRVPAGGGEPEELTTPDLELGNHLWPEILPGSEAVLYTVIAGNVETAQIVVLSLATGESKILIPGGSNPRYVPTGHIVYGVGGTLRAVGFDLATLEVTGDPAPVLEGVMTKSSGAANFGVSQSGSLVYIAGDESNVERTLVWVNREGREEALAAEPRAYASPRVSPDGSRIAIEVRDQEQDIWIWDVARETLTRLTFDSARDTRPTWTPDGLRVVFGLNGTPNSLLRKAADGTGSVELLDESTSNLLPQTFSPNGTQLVFAELNVGGGGFNIGVRSMDADGTLEPLSSHRVRRDERRSSRPTAAWLAYQSDASGQTRDLRAGRFPMSRKGGGKSRAVAAPSPCGRRTAASCSTCRPRWTVDGGSESQPGSSFALR